MNNNVGLIVIIDHEKCMILYETIKSIVYVNIEDDWRYTGKLYVENFDSLYDKNEFIKEGKNKYWGDDYEY